MEQLTLTDAAFYVAAFAAAMMAGYTLPVPSFIPAIVRRWLKISKPKGD